MAQKSPEKNRLLASSTLIHPRSPSQSTRNSPIRKTPNLLSTSNASLSPSRKVSTGVTTVRSAGVTNATTGGGGLPPSSQMSKEAARFAKHLKAFSNGLSTHRAGGSLGRGPSSSRFSASATAGSGTAATPSLFPSPVLRDSNKDNIGNNLNYTHTTTSTPQTPSNSLSSESKLSSNKALFMASLAASASTPRSVLGKRSSAIAGIIPTVSGTPEAPLSFPTPTLPLKPQLGPKTPKVTLGGFLGKTPSTTSATANTTAKSAGGSSSPKRTSTFGRVASVGPPKSMAAQAASSLTRTISSGGLTTKLEVVTNDWLGGGTSPKRGRKVYNQGDRFIPNRTATNMSSAKAKLDLVRHPSFSEPTDEASIAYSQQIAEACGINLDSRMLAFSAEPPSLDSNGRGDNSSSATMMRKIYSRHSSFTRSTSNLLLNKKRTILTSPEKVLDAPGLMDDYYLNLLDWSCSNMVAIGLGKSVFVWDAESGHVESLFTLPGNTDAVASVSWAYDGLYLAVGTFDGDTQIWDIETKSKVRSMTGHMARVGVLAWDKHILSSGCRDGSIWNHDVRVQNHKVAELSNHTNEVCGLVWRADGQQLASGGNDNLVNVWDARSTVPKYTKSNHTAAVKALSWSPWQNNLLASGGGTYDKQIHFWNTSTGARVNTLNTGSQVTSIVWSTEYKEFMSSHGFPDNNISLYGYPSMNKVIDIPAHDSRILHTALSPDGQTVATVASDENLKFWKLFERQPKGKKDGKRSATLTRAASFGGCSGSTGLGNDEDDERGGGVGGPRGLGTTIKGKTISSMTRIR
ncbi:quinon protein alcohol dehydrogenase-like superfamily [Dissophora ornata]|nr:quinon protein alcohol dehydrogenase-like superfamily [Dissophora ornata]